MSAHPNRASRARARGFSMVEALVALVVLCVGMLGMASLQMVAIRTSGSAISRMQAVNLASDIGDRIRANRNAGTAYEFDSAGNDDEGEGEGEGDGEEEETSISCVGTSQNCTASQMASYDLAEWARQINAALPGQPTGSVHVDTGTEPATYTITITWLEAGESQENRQSYVMRMQI